MKFIPRHRVLSFSLCVCSWESRQSQAIGRSEFLKEYSRILDAVYDSDLICGYCYTQLTDVEQETNGLLTSTHQYKFDPEKIKEINDRRNR